MTRFRNVAPTVLTKKNRVKCAKREELKKGQRILADP